MASSSFKGASTLSEVRVVGLCQYIFVSSFPKGRSYLCTRCYEFKTGAGTPATLVPLLFTGLRGMGVFEEVRRVPVQHVWACRTTVQLSYRQYPSVVLRCAYELDPYLRTQPLQEGFRLGGHLGGFLHVHDEVSASGAVHVGEVGRLGLQVLHDGLEGLGEPSFLDERVGLLGRYAGTYQEAHVFAPPLPASVKRVEPFHCKA